MTKLLPNFLEASIHYSFILIQHILPRRKIVKLFFLLPFLKVEISFMLTALSVGDMTSYLLQQPHLCRLYYNTVRLTLKMINVPFTYLLFVALHITEFTEFIG